MYELVIKTRNKLTYIFKAIDRYNIEKSIDLANECILDNLNFIIFGKVMIIRRDELLNFSTNL